MGSNELLIQGRYRIAFIVTLNGELYMKIFVMSDFGHFYDCFYRWGHNDILPMIAIAEMAEIVKDGTKGVWNVRALRNNLRKFHFSMEKSFIFPVSH